MPPTNRLIHETSPYLLQHAHNPVDWYPWGDEAFAAAREQDKPIFLSVGYATCYWCHVMERQVFENEKLAALLNEHCISIKVDREQRPDVDELYMTATQLLTSRGGWPMSVFLTPPNADAPGLKPFWAGTYIPPEPMHGMSGFGQLVTSVARAWREQREQVLQQADQVAEAVAAHLTKGDTAGELSPGHVQRALDQLLHSYDPVHRGFGGAPKFPHPANLKLLQAMTRHDRAGQVIGPLSHTLESMARGGIYDQVGGGFHRYSVDEQWLVPHFEKMLYDNAQLIDVYTSAYAGDPNGHNAPLWKRVACETCDYVLREMLDESGAFYSAQDAEVAGREGGNYLWTPQQIEQALADEPELIELAMTMYGLDRGPNFRDPHHADAEPANVLYLPQHLDLIARQRPGGIERLTRDRQRINERLLAIRDRRPQPATDDKVLTSWNGMMIAALAHAGRVFNERRYLDAAARAADAVLEHLVDDGDTLRRSMRRGEVSGLGFLEDYAYLVDGLIELALGQPAEARWLDEAQRFTHAAIERFSNNGGYYDTLAHQRDLFVRLRSTYDGVIPTANSQMIHNLLDLYALTDLESWLSRAITDLRSFGRLLAEQGVALVHMQHALLRALEIAPGRIDHAAGGGEIQPSQAPPPVVAAVEPEVVDLRHGSAELAVHVHIEPGFHLTAAQATDAGLTPTTLEFDGDNALSLDVEYPGAVERRPAFADRPLAVYEGDITLRAHLRRRSDAPSSARPRLMLRYQPCTDAACQQPHTIELPISIKT